MSLRDLVHEMVRVHRQSGRTPVLVTSARLKLNNGFVIALIKELAEVWAGSRSESPPIKPSRPVVRLDWMRAGEGLWSVIADRRARHRAAKITSAIQDSTEVNAQVQLTATIGRPGTASALVIGLCQPAAQLPFWAQTFYLDGSPS